MRRLRGAATGYLSLVVLYALVQTEHAGRLSGLAGTLTKMINRGLSPGVAGVPDHSSDRSGRGGPFLNDLGDRRRAGADTAADVPTAPGRGGPGTAPDANFSTVRG